MILINGQPENRIDVADRGLQYGDGLFETIAYRHGRLEFLSDHLSRLKEGCNRLNIAFSASQQQSLISEIDSVCQQLNSDAVIKVMITRGPGGRGYRYQSEMPTTRIISSHAMPVYPVANVSGITVRICQQRLAINPSLAGIKHLNRLEQILARNEWQDDTIAEGVMLDYQERVIEGTMSNLFLVKNNELLTAELSSAGIAGIMRKQLIKVADELGIPLNITTLTLDELKSAEEVFVCNSLIGIWPVIRITDLNVDFSHGPLTQILQNALNSINTDE
ncbi:MULTISPECIES: aminodeoxychorismate lyase [Methylophaga]|uniref:Aminodeoxychorismate lyase n=1 Tax=Methylophaga muralis TaxID=291169 RepID=A0A1E3GTU3_9GAMM|nr:MULTISPECIES: aminodeoxychorismate lyase [Methylophaga]ODN67470.1 Aminodeoxychorismate lyase [Methylophaga muralis]THK41249.1 aminodeoxychorismate lyase [Methylophaga sp. SB9B]